MVNIETLNALIDMAVLNAMLLYFGVLSWLVWKAMNYKPHQDVEDVIKKELLQRYYLKRQLLIEQSKSKQNIKKQKDLIKKLEENYKKLVIAQSLLEQYGNEDN